MEWLFDEVGSDRREQTRGRPQTAERANRELRTDPAMEMKGEARGENRYLALGQGRASEERHRRKNFADGGVGSRLVVTSSLEGVQSLRPLKMLRWPAFSTNHVRPAHNASRT